MHGGIVAAGTTSTSTKETGPLYINNCTFDSNRVYAHDATQRDGGGAVYNSGLMTVTHTTFSNNTGHLSPSATPSGPDSDTFFASGGAVFNAGWLFMKDTTVFGNVVDGEGGGIYIGRQAQATLINCTIAGNKGVYSGGIDGSAFDAALKIGNTIVSNNSDVGGEFLEPQRGRGISNRARAGAGAGTSPPREFLRPIP